MAKATSIAEALKQWEDKTSKRAAEAKVIDLQFMFGPIEKMDSALGSLVTCEKLSLSSNNIERIQSLNGMKSLKILSLARNNIKTLAGIETVADTLEELWVSYNKIDRIRQVTSLKKLTVFYISYNNLKDWTELNNVGQTPVTHLILIGNPMHEQAPDEETYKGNVMKRVPKLKVLDGVPCVSQPWES